MRRASPRQLLRPHDAQEAPVILIAQRVDNAVPLRLLEGSLLGIQSPIKREALRAARALEDAELVAQLGQTASSEQWSLIIIGLVATANVALGVWRPRFRSRATA